MTKEKEVSVLIGALRLWSALSHGAGALLGLVGTTILLCRAFFTGSYHEMGVFAIYGASVVVLYTASTLYHSIPGTLGCRLALRKFDHCAIYFLIAGSYTPICMLALGNTIGFGMLALIWLCAVAGMVLTAIKLAIPNWVSSLIYLAMGWVAVFAISPISQALSTTAMGLLLLGAVFYTIGGVLYAVKWPGRHNPRFGCHEIFHIFILLGSISHFVMMFYL